MNNMFKKYGLLVWLTFLLAGGFIFTSVAGYLTSKNTLQQSLAEQTLPITGDNVYSEIQKDILRPVFTSSLMAHDTFVRDWMLNGEEDQELITKYLKEVKIKNNAVTSFLVSNQTLHYYHADGLLKTIKEGEPRDVWFYRVKNLKADYETNVDVDLANHDAVTIFVNYRIKDYQGQFLGVTGIGLTLDTLRQLIDSYQKRFARRIMFADASGKIMLAGSGYSLKAQRLQDVPGLNTVTPAILANKKSQSLHLEYAGEKGTVLLNSRFLPELGWHLLVEQELDTELRPVQNMLLVNIAISAGITLTIAIIMLFMVRRYQQRLERSASTDALTGLLNRQAFDFVFKAAILDAERSRQPMCAVLLDIDFFKKVNDKHGHLVGDHVLKEISAIARRSLRESDVLCRWGGEEFLILLKNCTLEKATSIAENLRGTIEGNDFSRTTELLKTRMNVTVSMGVAQCKENESEDSVFERADQALYQAKENGRNSVYFAEC